MACFGGGILDNDEAADFIDGVKRRKVAGKLKAVRGAFKESIETPLWPVLNYCEPENAAAIRRDIPSFQLLRVPRSWIGGPYLKNLPIPEGEDTVDAYVTEGALPFFSCAAAALILADNLTNFGGTPPDLSLGKLSLSQRQRLLNDAKAALNHIAESSAVKTWFSECASLELYGAWLGQVSLLRERLEQVVGGAT